MNLGPPLVRDVRAARVAVVPKDARRREAVVPEARRLVLRRRRRRRVVPRLELLLRRLVGGQHADAGPAG